MQTLASKSSRYAGGGWVSKDRTGTSIGAHGGKFFNEVITEQTGTSFLRKTAQPDTGGEHASWTKGKTVY
eukprot:3218225-Prymnesium_polylepis.1